MKSLCVRLLILFVAMTFVFIQPYVFAAEKRYVGSKACSSCHEEEYKTFVQFAKKAHSFHAIERMQDGLTGEELKECYKCHTTGYGKPGGFVSIEKTPEMKDAGCEVCHGPGSVHIESAETKDILGGKKMTMKMCEECHNPERISSFNFKPMLHGGAH